jgi:hypothetical protein
VERNAPNDEGYYFDVAVWEEPMVGYRAQASVSRSPQMTNWILGRGQSRIDPHLASLAAPDKFAAVRIHVAATDYAVREARIDAMANFIKAWPIKIVEGKP